MNTQRTSIKKLLGIFSFLMVAMAVLVVAVNTTFDSNPAYTIKAYDDDYDYDDDEYEDRYEDMDDMRRDDDDDDKYRERNRIMERYGDQDDDDDYRMDDMDDEDMDDDMDDMDDRGKKYGREGRDFDEDIEERMENFIKRMEAKEKQYMLNLGRKIQDDIKKCREEYGNDKEKLQECIREEVFDDWKEHRGELLEDVYERLERVRERIRESRILSVAEKARLLAKVRNIEQKVMALGQKEDITREEVVELTKEIRAVASELQNEIRQRARQRVVRRIDRVVSVLERAYERNKDRFDTDTRAKLETILTDLKALAGTIKGSERPSNTDIERFKTLAKEFIESLKEALGS